jgi:hypothetical protein
LSNGNIVQQEQDKNRPGVREKGLDLDAKTEEAAIQSADQRDPQGGRQGHPTTGDQQEQHAGDK